MDYNLQDYANYYKKDPLYILLIDEMFLTIRKAFNNLDIDTKIILNYSIIENNIDKIDTKIIKSALDKLKNNYLNY